MNLLLDTHSLLWFVLEDPRLSAKARKSIDSKDGLIFISPASLWEIAIKISIGKYILPFPFESFWDEQMRINNFSLLSITLSHAARIASLPFHHRDPCDRLIIAQSIEEDMAVVSHDISFDLYGVNRIW